VLYAIETVTWCPGSSDYPSNCDLLMLLPQKEEHMRRRTMRTRLFVVVSAALMSWGLVAGSGVAAAVAVTPILVQPSDTGAGIDNETSTDRYHRVYTPPQARNVLVLFLGGSGSRPSDYDDISASAAGLGYGTINLSYNDTAPLLTVGLTCALSDPCYANYRGETIFGKDVVYAPGVGPWDALAITVSKANSVVNRLVNLIDYLTHDADTSDDTYWSQFVVSNANSPYTTTHLGAVYPNWSKIVVSGHSQGGGHAAFLGVKLPQAVRRVVMFSSPNDNVNGVSASWVTSTSTTGLDRFWGLRNADEGSYGSFTPVNWGNLGGPGSGGVGDPTNNAEVVIGNGSGDPQQAQRLVLTPPSGATSSANHFSTAVDTYYYPNVPEAWEYLFTANHTD
jgi:hypothetical protein